MVTVLFKRYKLLVKVCGRGLVIVGVQMSDGARWSVMLGVVRHWLDSDEGVRVAQRQRWDGGFGGGATSCCFGLERRDTLLILDRCQQSIRRQGRRQIIQDRGFAAPMSIILSLLCSLNMVGPQRLKKYFINLLFYFLISVDQSY
ncbi:hypothetical protein RchiOBHm_Chr3g0492721 [Rosa chinensis]|uniref:Uncharacterized protein n=1 Tax=Rosa chinensis TaxID=74649 RepID=A0A2P6RGK5_ROSCH|nr:hypothetical protein RchiOBHm_Chr3g0492721 [Rosa chinensis]